MPAHEQTPAGSIDPKRAEKVRMTLEALRNFALETFEHQGVATSEVMVLAALMEKLAGRLLQESTSVQEFGLSQLDLFFASFRLLLRDGNGDERNAKLDAIARQFIDVSLESFQARRGDN